MALWISQHIGVSARCGVEKLNRFHEGLK
ncbi:hypothetical protein [Rhodoferax sp.]